MRKMRIFLSLCLTICMMMSMFVGFIPAASAEGETLPKYLNNGGNLVKTINSDGGVMGSFSSTFNTEIVNGKKVFELGRYARNTGGATPVGTGWVSGEIGNWVFTTTDGTAGSWNSWIWQTCAYSTIANLVSGTRFNAPFTGKIKVTYQLGNGTHFLSNGTVGDATSWGGGAGQNIDLVVGKDDLAMNSTDGSISNAITRIPTKDLTAEDFLTQKTMELDVKAGESVYFMIHNGDGAQHLAYFYINSVEYTEMKLSTDTAEVIGHNIAALDTPVVRFYVKVSASAVGYAANITIGNDAPISVSGTYAVGIKGPDGNELTEADHVLVYSIPVSAKRMTETITISIKNDEGSEMLTKKNTYSVNTYCAAQVAAYKTAGEAATEEQLALAKICTQILAYGRMAQKYFSYNIENLPAIDADVYALLAADMAN